MVRRLGQHLWRRAGAMPLPRSGSDPRAGFTLIELMIAVTVLALLTTTLTLSINRPRAASAGDPARFQALHALMREQAVLSRQILGLRIDADGYQRLRWDGQWRDVGAPARWRGGVVVILPTAAPVEFAPSGQATPTRLRFGTGESTTTCETGAWEQVTCRAG